MSKVILSIGVVILTSCATIMNGSTQLVGFSSSPTNARIEVNGKYLGETPLSAELKRKDSHMVRFELDGYQPYEIMLTRKTSGWVWGNILFGGLIGLVVDAATGSMYKINPESVSGDLLPLQASSDDSEILFIKVAMNVDKSLEKVGQLEKVK